MHARCALLIDGEGGFAEVLQGWLGPLGLSLELRSEWTQELATSLRPAIIFVAVDLPTKTGFLHCRRAREGAPAVPVVLATATIAPDELELNRQAESAAACLDKRKVTREEVIAKVETLLSPLRERSDPAPAAEPGKGGGVSDEPGPDRTAELEEDLRRLRSELDVTRQAAQDGDFLRLSGVVATKEKEVVRLKKEIAARDHDIVTSRRGLREALSQATAAKREREQVSGHVGQLTKDLEDARGDALRLRVEAQRQAAEAEQARAELDHERRQHADSRKRHDATLAAHAETLKAVKQEQQAARAAFERQVRTERAEAVSARSRKWRARFERIRRDHDHSVALLHDQLRELRARHEREIALRDSEHQAALDGAAEKLAAESRRSLGELQHRHEVALAEALAAHAAAEKRANQRRFAERETKSRLQAEKAEALAAAEAEGERRLEELRSGYDASLRAMGEHFDEQLTAVQAAEKQGRAEEAAAAEARLRRVSGELATALAQAEQQDREVHEAYERQLAELQARHAEAATALTARLRHEHEQATCAAAAEWGQRLEDLRRQHAGSLEELRREFASQIEAVASATAQEQSRRDEEHETARRRGAEELFAERERAAQLEREALQRHETELAGAEARRAEAMAALEARLRREHDEAVAAAVTTWEGRLERQRRAHEDGIAALRAAHRQELSDREGQNQAALARWADDLAGARAEAERRHEELRRQQEAALEVVRTEHAEAEKQAEAAHRQELDASESRLREEQAGALAATVAEWQGRLEELRRGHAASLEALRRAAQARLEAQGAASGTRLAERDAEQRAALQHAAEELAAAKVQAARLDQETREGHEGELARLESEQREASTAVEARLRSEHDQALAATVRVWERTLDELRQGHGASLETLRRQHEEEIASLQVAGKQERAARDDEHESRMRRLGDELAAARHRITQLEREARRHQAEGQALSPERHSQALAALESRLRAEHEEAMAAIVAEWKARSDRLRRGNADAIAALRREHQDQLDALEAARQQGAARPRASASEKVVPRKAVTGDRSG